MAPSFVGGKLGGKGARGPFRNNIVADLSQLLVVQDYIQPSLDEDWQLSSEDDDLSYYSGPLSEDAVIAVDYIQGWIEDDQSSDELEYDFTFALFEDAQVYAAQFFDDESLDETEYDFISSPLSDDFIAAIDQIGQSFEDGDEDQPEYDFFTGPLSDNFVIAVDVPYANFDEYDDAFEGEEYSFYLGVISDDAPIPPLFIPQGDGDYPKHRGVKPIVRIRPKVERDLEDALELVEEISGNNRVTENKKTAKAALAIVKAIVTLDVYAPVLENIKKSLTRAVRKTANHEGLEAAATTVAKEIDDLVAAMQSRRKRQQREEEELILWLSNMTNNPLVLLE